MSHVSADLTQYLSKRDFWRKRLVMVHIVMYKSDIYPETIPLVVPVSDGTLPAKVLCGPGLRAKRGEEGGEEEEKYMSRTAVMSFRAGRHTRCR